MLSQDEVDRVVMLASSYGLLMSPSYGSYAHLPLSLVPTRFPENAFKSLIAKTPAHNQLMFLVSKNPKYLYDALKEICQIDDFTNKLVDISRKSHDSKYFQNIFLGLTRNDFMLDGPSNNFLQVEYNTIAASFLSLGTKVLDFHQHVSSLLPNIEASRPYQNNPLFNFAKTIQLAYNLYGNKGAVIFIVLEDEKNIFDQTSLEIELWKNW
jgi:Eukaryotic glutathione synthase, ATP binding domain